MTPVLVIAEIGECWAGEMWQAERLIQVAAEAGCDYAKFQALDTEGLAPDDEERAWFHTLALNRKQLEHVRRCAMQAGIRFLVTPEKALQAKMLYEMGSEAVKIASSCLMDYALLDFVNGRFKRVFLSTGLAELEEVDEAVARLDQIQELYLLHCIAEYPTGPLLAKRGLVALDDQDVHLAMMQILAERYPHAQVGYSDHTVGLLAPMVAAAAGARVIEKHVTLDRRTPVERFVAGGPYLGTDHVLSVEPDELKTLVRSVRKVEAMLGSAEWRRSPGEVVLREFLRQRFHHTA